MMRDYYAVLGVATARLGDADPAGVPAACAAIFARREPLAAGGAGPLRGDRRGLSRARRSDGARGVRPRAVGVGASRAGTVPARRARRVAAATICTCRSSWHSSRRCPGSPPISRRSGCRRAPSAARAARRRERPRDVQLLRRPRHGLERRGVRPVRWRVRPATAPARAPSIPVPPAAAAACDRARGRAVTLPPGHGHGRPDPRRGRGARGPYGGPRGDLIVIARVHERSGVHPQG